MTITMLPPASHIRPRRPLSPAASSRPEYSPQAREEGWAWIRATQAGDRSAFGLLYTRYEPQVRRYIQRMVSRRFDPATVDDLVSQTFCNALDDIDQVHYEDADVMLWLATLARNVALNHVGRAHVRHEVQAADHVFDGDRPTGGVSEFGNPEREVLAKFDREAISQAVRAGVDQLNPPQRQCVQLRYLADRSLPEAARVMGRSEIAVRQLSARARTELATILAPGANRRAGRGSCRAPRQARFEAGQLYRVKAVADRVDMHVATINHAIKAGELDAVRVGAGKGMYLIPGEAITSYLTDHAPADHEAAERAGTKTPGYVVAVERARTLYTQAQYSVPMSTEGEAA